MTRHPSTKGLSLLVAGVLSAVPAQPTTNAEPLPAPFKELLDAHCTDCHDKTTKKGGVDLEFDAVQWDDSTQTSLLERVHAALQKGSMPPPKKERPKAELANFTRDWIDSGLTLKKPKNATPYRRLNRAEYLQTIKRLFDGGFQLPSGFPEDTRSHGFDNVAESLAFSPPLLESYAESATLVANRVFKLPRNVESETRSLAAKDFSTTERDLGGPTTLPMANAMRLALSGEKTSPNDLRIHASGTYRIKIKAAANNANLDTPPKLRIRSGASETEIPIPSSQPTVYAAELIIHEGAKLLFEHSNAPHTHLVRGNFKKQLDQVKERLKANPNLFSNWLSFHEEKIDSNKKISLVRKAEYASVDDVALSDIFTKAFAQLPTETPHDLQLPESSLDLLVECMARSSEFYVRPWNWLAFHRGPSIDLLELTIEGPITRVEDAEDRMSKQLQQNLIGTPPLAAGSPEWIEHCTRKILERAFRRPPSPSETQSYGALVKNHLDAGHSPLESLHHLLRGTLLSPHFLYRESRRDGAPLPIDQLAGRLSYMLTQGPPDPALLAAVQDRSFLEKETFLTHARRLLEAAPAESFAKNFVEQWLGTRVINQITPSPQLGVFDGRHYNALAQEPYLLFHEVLKEKRPLSDLIDPDFTFTNFIVAKQIYRMDPPPTEKGDADPKLIRIPLPRGGRHGGFLGMAGTMMATANGVDTQPVSRGKWVLENILNDPPPPPPPSVPAITPDTRGAKTIRDLMAAHTQEESCAGCHRKLDPPGFVLENFDAIGAWRDHYPIHSTDGKGKPVTTAGPPVIAEATLHDGTQINNVQDLKKYITSHLEDFGTCVATKLFIHGTGRIPDHAERKMLASLTRQNLRESGSLTDLLFAVLATDEFRTR